jgi:hypothetical protein
VPSVVVTSAGLGQARFAFADQPARQFHVLNLGRLDASGRLLRLCLATDLVPAPGDAVEGHVLVIAGAEPPIEVPIALDRPATDPPSAALAWFLALVFPALVALGAAWITARIAERRKQKVRFERFLDLAHRDLRDFFETHYETIRAERADDREFAMKLERALRDQRIWTRIPDRERRRLIRCLHTGTRETITRDLQEIFAEWKNAIAHTPSGGGVGV